MIHPIEGVPRSRIFHRLMMDARTRSETRGMIGPSLVKDRRATNPGSRLVGARMIPNVPRDSQQRDDPGTRWNGGCEGSTITRRIWTRRDQTWSSKVKERTDDDEGICHGDG